MYGLLTNEVTPHCVNGVSCYDILYFSLNTCFFSPLSKQLVTNELDVIFKAQMTTELVVLRDTLLRIYVVKVYKSQQHVGVLAILYTNRNFLVY